jgi:type II secretory pathway component PulF
LPGFRESSLSQFAATMRLLLAAGTDLPRALALVGNLEQGTAVGRELARWRERLAGGAGRISEFAAASRLFPPMFLWLVGQGGEDLAGGFGRAAEIYGERARYRVEMMLYAALPVAVLALGGVIVCQLLLALRVCGLVTGLDMLGGVGGD